MRIPEQYADLLSTRALAHVATIGPRGEPQSTPVWFDWDGTDLLFSQTTDRQKYRNLLRNPKVAVSIVDPANPYRYLELRGTAVSIDPDEDNAFIDAMAKKYLSHDRYQWSRPGDRRVIVRVRPEHTTQMG